MVDGGTFPWSRGVSGCGRGRNVFGVDAVGWDGEEKGT